MSIKKVLIVGGGAAYAQMFERNGFAVTTVIADADLLCPPTALTIGGTPYRELTGPFCRVP